MRSKATTIFSNINKSFQNGGNKNTMVNMTRGSKIILFKTKTVFPFTLFPDTIIIDLDKLNIIRKDFFWTKRINSINHEDILNITAECAPLFASLKITTRFFSNKPIVISFLKKSDAMLIRRLAHGLIIAHRKNIHLRDVETGLLLKQLKQLGSTD